MSTRSYSASLSQSQGRSGYSIIFRHPARRDETTGKLGIRVRRGLGTRDKTEAEQFRDELNQLLAEPRYRDPAARAEAEQRFDPRVVDIYFHKMSLEEFDFHALREKTIPLPPREPDGYRHVLLLGTTGAGKTTLVRQLIGTDPSEERFPSTSTSKRPFRSHRVSPMVTDTCFCLARPVPGRQPSSGSLSALIRRRNASLQHLPPRPLSTIPRSS